MRLAEQACGLTGGKQPQFLATLDAAYAEAGRFPEAIAAATRTRDLALAAGQKEIAEAAEKRLALYAEQKALRVGGR